MRTRSCSRPGIRWAPLPADPSDRAQAKERGYDVLDPIDTAYAAGHIDQDEWHRRVLAVIEPAYLAGDERMGSGHSGSAAEWERSRSIVMEAIERDGTFLDVGCANGLLMASVQRWSAERGLRVEPYGIDISAALADLARSRYPQWSQRIWVGNAAAWAPPMRFDIVRTGMEYVPVDRREPFVAHLVDHVVRPGGRLIIGKSNEDRGELGVPGGAASIAATVASWGWSGIQEVRRPHEHPDVEQTLVWFDLPD